MTPLPSAGAAPRSRHRTRAVALALAAVVAVGSVTASAAASSSSVARSPVAPAPAAARVPFRVDLYGRGDFVSQATVYQCVGASLQMMANIVGTENDRTIARQNELQQLARSFRRANDPTQLNSGPRRSLRGASSAGWAAGLETLGLGLYRVTARPSFDEAVLVAAQQLQRTQRPVGLLVWRGAHAWVMTGFDATGDPLTDRNVRITHLWVLDPWYPRVSQTWGPGVAPHTRLSVAQLGMDWVAWRRSRNRPGLTNRWAMILPFDESRPATRRFNLR